MKSERLRGITDVTSSESRLGKLVLIGGMLREGPKPLTILRGLIASQVGLRNESVIRRHLRLAETLDLLRTEGGRARLTGSGRALLSLNRPAALKDLTLSAYDQAYFVEALFDVATLQLVRLMQVIGQERKSEPEAVIIRYFERNGDLPWVQATVRTSLDAFRRSGVVPRLLRHKVTCMVGWLRDLGIVEIPTPYRLTLAGDSILSLWEEDRRRFTTGLAYIAATALSVGGTRMTRLDQKHLPPWLVDYAVEVARQTQSGLSMTPFDEASVLCRLKLLVERGIVVEPEDFYELVKEAWRQRKVRSIILGRDGKPAEVRLPP